MAKAPSIKKSPQVEQPENAPEKLPATNVNQRNTLTSEDVEETNKDAPARAADAADMVVTRTGQLPADVDALEAELVDQVAAEAEGEKQATTLSYGMQDALSLERLDHARTLKQALGLRQEDSSEEERRLAEERNKGLRTTLRDTSKDNYLNSIPANWVVTEAEGDNIEAYNRITGKEYSGPASQLMQSATAKEDSKPSTDGKVEETADEE